MMKKLFVMIAILAMSTATMAGEVEELRARYDATKASMVSTKQTIDTLETELAGDRAAADVARRELDTANARVKDLTDLATRTADQERELGRRQLLAEQAATRLAERQAVVTAKVSRQDAAKSKYNDLWNVKDEIWKDLTVAAASESAVAKAEAAAARQEIATLKAQVTTLQTEVGAVKTVTARTEEKVDAAITKIDVVDAKVTALQTSLANFEKFARESFNAVMLADKAEAERFQAYVQSVDGRLCRVASAEQVEKLRDEVRLVCGGYRCAPVPAPVVHVSVPAPVAVAPPPSCWRVVYTRCGQPIVLRYYP